MGDRARTTRSSAHRRRTSRSLPRRAGIAGAVTKDSAPSDRRIHEDVCERLTEDRFIDASNIHVAVKEGEVALPGAVSSRGLKRRAEDFAEMACGVAHVRNDLRVEGA
jgi:osmotically-inducible protein OsmY